MGQETESFWADIKRYEDTLAKDPGSYCFAPLSELYRKVGLLDDAINVAKKGIELHSEYVGGYMALGRACFEKELKEESRGALEKVIRATPDNLMAQKLLSQLYIDAGETELARKALETILSLNPDDLESKVALEAFSRAAERVYQPDEGIFPDEAEGIAGISVPFANDVDLDDESLLEEAEIIEDLYDEVFDEEGVAWDTADVAAGDVATYEKTAGAADLDPLSTVTIAELYISQGFLKKALKIYRDLLDAEPENDELKQRLLELKLRIDEDEAKARENALEPAMAISESTMSEIDNSSLDEHTAREPVAVLEAWLENIGRIRECRSGKY